MVTIDLIAKAIENVFDKIKSPANILPAVLLYCAASQRTGTSASRAAAEAISNNPALGISTTDNPDGSPNVVNQYTYNIIKCVLDEIKTNGVVQVAIPPGSIMVQAEGGNAGGPVICIGTNIRTSTARGILR